MPFKCPNCDAEIIRYCLSGVYLHQDEDIPVLKEEGSVFMRYSGRFKPIAMVECPNCGIVSFLTWEKAEELKLEKIPYSNLVHEKTNPEKEDKS